MMRILFFFGMLFSFLGCTPNSVQVKLLQLNIWHEGRQVEGGFEGIVQQIMDSEADIVLLSEINNADDTRFCDRITEALKTQGIVMHTFYSSDTGILSRYPIKEHKEVFNAGNNTNKAVIEILGKEVAIYSAHLDYLNCSYYLVRGFHSSTWKKLDSLVTDVDSILQDNVMSKRDDAMTVFLEEAQKDKQLGRIVILGGDFNEPSHLDWTEETKFMFERNGMVIPWTVSSMLADAGYVDVYRAKYPNPVTHPGITYPSNNAADMEKLTWAPGADERERIDFIYYAPSYDLLLDEVCIWGPDSSISKNERVKDVTDDCFKQGQGIWPTDHKGVLASFIIKANP